MNLDSELLPKPIADAGVTRLAGMDGFSDAIQSEGRFFRSAEGLLPQRDRAQAT
jgi:hypothetical protein